MGRILTTHHRKNFDRHFQVSYIFTQLRMVLTSFVQESRHAFGMRALGLPNTKHFHEITRIEDALGCKYPSLAVSDLVDLPGM